MSFTQEFVPLALDNLRKEAAIMKADRWRFVQTHAVATDEGVDLYYTFMKDGLLKNYHISGVKPETQVPSITDMFLAAFVFENEARELFGVNMSPIAIDFKGMMYAPAVGDPMTIITPEQKAARDKARKAAEQKAAKAESGSGGEAPTGTKAGRKPFIMTPELQARLDAKMPSLSPEKAEKVKAALEARSKELETFTPNVTESTQDARSQARAEGEALETQGAAATAEDKAFANAIEASLTSDSLLPVDKDLAAILDTMDPLRAERVRNALEGTATPTESDLNNREGVNQPLTELFSDEEMEALLALMGPDRAAKVMNAFMQEEGR